MWKGILYNAVSKYSGVLINLGITAILSRVLTPEEFGIVALVFVFTGFFNLLGNLGLGPAIVQTLDLSAEDIGSIFVFSGCMALLLALLFFLSGGLLADFYTEPNLVSVVRLLSLSVFFNILSIVPSALNKKALRFKQMGIVNVSVQALTGFIAILMAMNGYSYYSLVFQNILTGFFVFSIFFYLYPIKVFKLNIAPLKRIASYSSFQFAYNVINYFSRNLDNLLIGKYLGNAPLGYYNKSYSLMVLPVYNLTHVISPVLHPVLAKHQNDHTFIYKSYLNVVKLLAGIGFPLSVFLYFTASELIYVMFGPQWEMSVPVFKILAMSVGMQVCMSSTSAIFQATNRTNLLFTSGLLSSIFMVGGISYGVFYGESLLAVAYGLLFAFTINFFLVFYMLMRKALKKSYLSFLKVFLIPLIASFITVITMLGINLIEIDNSLINLVVKTLGFVFVAAAFFLLPKQNRNFLRNMIKKKTDKDI